MNKRIIAALFALGSVTSAALGYWVAAETRQLLVFDYCALPGANCIQAPTLPPDVYELILCCNHVTGECVEVSHLSDCHPEFEFAVMCTHGRSVAVSGGTECYD